MEWVNDCDICYAQKLITVPKTSHIQIISGVSPTEPITAEAGKLSKVLVFRFSWHIPHDDQGAALYRS